MILWLVVKFIVRALPPQASDVRKLNIALRSFLHARTVMRRPTHNTAKLPRQLLDELGVKGTGRPFTPHNVR